MRGILRLGALPPGALLVAAFMPAPASAQDNQVFLGQVGITNTIRIDQTGASNIVGAESFGLRVEQSGDLNEITINQFGNNNVAGVPAIPGRGVASGFSQSGDRNIVEIGQRTGEIGGANAIGAINQSALFFGPDPDAVANSLIVRQQGGSAAAPGFGDHFVGEIAQTNPFVGPVDPNLIDILQIGGGDGVGNRIGSVLQNGAGIVVDIVQDGTENAADTVVQIGAANELTIGQSGAANTIGTAQQAGALNRAEIAQTGDGNAVLSLFQDNENRVVAGNSVVLSFVGDGNGGDRDASLHAPGPGLTLVGVLDSGVTQIGDGNELRYTVGVNVAGGQADSNLFGFFQDGDGNAIAGAVTGDANEAYVRQSGDGNVLDFFQDAAPAASRGNRLAAIMDGESNLISADQAGSDNDVRIQINGDRNGGFLVVRPPADLRSFTGLPAGIVQRGEGNFFSLDIMGDDNLFAALQSGLGNEALVSVVGSGNQAFVTQIGDNNLSVLSQNGSGNIAVIVQ